MNITTNKKQLSRATSNQFKLHNSTELHRTNIFRLSHSHKRYSSHCSLFSSSMWRYTILCLFILQATLHTSATAIRSLPTESIPTIPSHAQLQEDSTSTRRSGTKDVDISRINQHLDLGLVGGDGRFNSLQQSIYEIITTTKFFPQNSLPYPIVEKWPHATIFYDMDPSFKRVQIDLVQQAIREITEVSECLFFQRKVGNNAQNYINFTNTIGCWSYIGMQGGEQEIAIGSSQCNYRNVIIHLVLHAAGRFHEENRPDRDLNVRIVPENIKPGMETNFDIYPEELSQTNGISYNYESLMHSKRKSSSLKTSYGGRKDTIRALVTIQDNFGSSAMTKTDKLLIQAMYCDYLLEPVDWTEWSFWSKCSASCNSGLKYRTRICVKNTDYQYCPGGNIQVKRCHMPACSPSNPPPYWSAWGHWSHCSVSCGGGRTVKVRECIGADVCTRGRSRQYRSCNVHSCPNTEWKPWSTWSSCSSSCHFGFITRTRKCQIDTCNGHPSETRICNYNKPCQPVWDEWSSWSNCSNGTLTRNRTCLVKKSKCNGAHIETIGCGFASTQSNSTVSEPLPTSGTWTPWSPCNTTCGTGNKTRYNSCNGLQCSQVRRCQIIRRC